MHSFSITLVRPLGPRLDDKAVARAAYERHRQLNEAENP